MVCYCTCMSQKTMPAILAKLGVFLYEIGVLVGGFLGCFLVLGVFLYVYWWVVFLGVFLYEIGVLYWWVVFLGVFLYEIGVLMGVKWGQKKRYSESQNFDVQQAHPHTKIFEEPPGLNSTLIEIETSCSLVHCHKGTSIWISCIQLASSFTPFRKWLMVVG